MAPENSSQRGASIVNPKFAIDWPVSYLMINNASRILVSILNFVSPIYGRRRIENLETGDIFQLVTRDARSILLLDVRSDCETVVSMIPGAMTRRNFECRCRELQKNLVVAYCTVGGRSLLYAQQLAAKGFDVRNYGGSILAWCEDGNPLVKPDGSTTNQLHTHNRFIKAPSGYERVWKALPDDR